MLQLVSEGGWNMDPALQVIMEQLNELKSDISTNRVKDWEVKEYLLMGS
jgi:uncharacterized protein YegL